MITFLCFFGIKTRKLIIHRSFFQNFFHRESKSCGCFVGVQFDIYVAYVYIGLSVSWSALGLKGSLITIRTGTSFLSFISYL